MMMMKKHDNIAAIADPCSFVVLIMETEESAETVEIIKKAIKQETEPKSPEPEAPVTEEPEPESTLEVPEEAKETPKTKEPARRRNRRVTAYNVYLQEKIQQNPDHTFAELSSKSSKEWTLLPDADKLEYFKKANDATEKLNSVTKTEDLKYLCEQCNRKYKKHVHYRLHLKDCGKKIVCDICQMEFSQSSNLRNHVRVVHDKVNKFNCPVCERPFANQYNLVNHLRTHNGDQPFKCPTCQANFNVKSNLNRHQRMFCH